MSTVAEILTAVGYRFTRLTISATSNPTTTEVEAWLNEDIKWLLGICAEERSEIGRTLGSITTIKATITAITAANPGSVTATAHGIGSGGAVGLIKDVAGMTDVNDTWYTLTYVNANTITIGVDTSSYDAYTSSGYIYVAEYTDLASDIYAPCEMVDGKGDLYAGWIKGDTTRNPLQLTTESSCIDYNPTGVAEPTKFYLDASGNVTFLQTPDDAYTIKIPYWQIQTAVSGTSTMPFGGIFDNLLIQSLVLRIQNKDEHDPSYELTWFKFLSEKARKLIHMRKGQKIEIGL